MSGFQTQVNVQPAPLEAGDFCSANPRSSFQSGPGGLIAGAAGVTVGAFAWVTYLTADADYAPGTVNSFGFGAPSGFIHREMQALNTAYPPYVTAAGDNTIPSGFAIGSLFRSGDFAMLNSGTTQATPGMTAYAFLATGLVRFGTTNTTVTCATSTVTTPTAISVTATANNNILTVSAVSTGTVVAGATLTGSGLIGSGTTLQVIGQVTPLLAGESLGGVGRYYLNTAEQNVATPITVTGTYGLLTLGAAPSGAIPIGALVTGGTVGNPCYVRQLLSGTGGSGSTYSVDNATTSTSATLTFTLDVATNWVADSAGAPGEIIKTRCIIP